LRIITDKTAGLRFSEQVGIPIAAGLIVGEALVGVVITMIKIFWPSTATAQEAGQIWQVLQQTVLQVF
jgi:uncharacterized oligopeptide transporter (OPT) family protein